jgi:hypothetical protein
MHGIPVRPRSLAPISRRVVQRQNRPLITVKLPVRLGPRLPVLKRCGAEAARLAHNQKAMGSSPITATNCRDSKGSPCAPLKPATSGCDPWSRHQLRVSSKGRASVFQTDDASVRVRLPAPVSLAASNQGECAALLRRNELGSIPRLPAIYRRVLVNDADSKPAKESSILLRRCQSTARARGVSQVDRARSCNLRERGSIPRPHSRNRTMVA